MRDSQNDISVGLKGKNLVGQNRYKIGKQIGSGTFGKVFQAVDLNTGEAVAIKQAFQDKKYKNRELDVISKIKNDNIISMKDYYFTQIKQHKYLYIVMDIYQSNLQNIFKLFRKQKRMFKNIEIKILAFQIFKALYYLQKQKICHRDLKPPNILINNQTLELRICDFGSAKIFNMVEKNVTYICSRYYRAPQLLFQYCMYGTEVDVWSIGCILIQFLTFQPIFPGDSTLEQLIQIIKVLGVPSKEYMKKYAVFYHQELNFPFIPPNKWQKVLKKYKPQQSFLDLISKILIYDVQKRLKPIQILMHPYFHDLILPQYRQMTQKLPNLFNFDGLLGFNNNNEVNQLKNIYCNRQIFKKVKSIEKSLSSSLKLETGDSTPSIQHINQHLNDHLNQYDKSLQRTSSTIPSKKQIHNDNQVR